MTRIKTFCRCPGIHLDGSHLASCSLSRDPTREEIAVRGELRELREELAELDAMADLCRLADDDRPRDRSERIHRRLIFGFCAYGAGWILFALYKAATV